MRVTNLHNWQRTKGIVAFVLFIVSLCLIGGLEGEEPVKHPYWFVASLVATGYMVHSSTKHWRR